MSQWHIQDLLKEVAIMESGPAEHRAAEHHAILDDFLPNKDGFITEVRLKWADH